MAYIAEAERRHERTFEIGRTLSSSIGISTSRTYRPNDEVKPSGEYVLQGNPPVGGQLRRADAAAARTQNDRLPPSDDGRLCVQRGLIRKHLDRHRCRVRLPHACSRRTEQTPPSVRRRTVRQSLPGAPKASSRLQVSRVSRKGIKWHRSRGKRLPRAIGRRGTATERCRRTDARLNKPF